MNPESSRRSTGAQFGETSLSAADERSLYGEPRHEPREADDEQTLYGEPQHESDDAETRDVELLFVRMQSASLRSDSLGEGTAPSVETTER